MIYSLKIRKLKKQVSDPKLNTQERKKLKKQLFYLEKRQRQFVKTFKKALVIGITLTVAALILLYFASRPKYPPTDIVGHVEVYPKSRVSSKKIPTSVQKHILEHTPSGQRGVLIQYNCKKYKCEKGLVNKLAEIAQKYPFVYVAPADYSGKIILTKIGRIKIMNNLDEKAIEEFIVN